MKGLENLAPTEDLSGAWCNGSLAGTSFLEAVSFVTPVLEAYFIASVSDALRSRRHPDLAERCESFVREEVDHSRAHNRLNARCLDYLERRPPGVGFVSFLLGAARKRLSLPSRLLLVAALEHVAAVASKVYLKQAPGWQIDCAYARALLTEHALEELGHCAVAFDLSQREGVVGRLGRIGVTAAVSATAVAFLAVSVPWILHRKTGRQLGRTASALGRAALSPRAFAAAKTPVVELVSFAHADYHPRLLVGDTGGLG